MRVMKTSFALGSKGTRTFTDVPANLRMRDLAPETHLVVVPYVIFSLSFSDLSSPLVLCRLTLCLLKWQKSLISLLIALAPAVFEVLKFSPTVRLIRQARSTVLCQEMHRTGCAGNTL